MAESVGTAMDERVAFRCPTCGAENDGPMTITMETDLIEVPDRVEEMWPGGPLVDVSLMRRYVAGQRWLSTSACSDRFSLSVYDMAYLRHESDGGTATTLVVTPK